MKKKHLPRYLVLENVKFFERSESCKQLLDALSSGIQFSKYSRFHENFFLMLFSYLLLVPEALFIVNFWSLRQILEFQIREPGIFLSLSVEKV